MGLSIIICTCNARDRIAKCIEALLSASEHASGISWELVLVDNASTDGTADFVQELFRSRGVESRLRVVVEPRKGVHFARPSGISAASYEYFSFIDDDNIVCDDWIKRVVSYLDMHENVVLLGSKSRGVYNTQVPKWFGNLESILAVGPGMVRGEAGLPKHLWTAGLSGRTSEVKAAMDLGPFFTVGNDKRPSGRGEDKELCFRVLLLGGEVDHCPELTFEHDLGPKRTAWSHLEKLTLANGRVNPILQVYQRRLERRPWLAFPLILPVLVWWKFISNIFKAGAAVYLRRPGDKRRLMYLSQKKALVYSFKEMFYLFKVYSFVKKIDCRIR